MAPRSRAAFCLLLLSWQAPALRLLPPCRYKSRHQGTCCKQTFKRTGGLIHAAPCSHSFGFMKMRANGKSEKMFSKSPAFHPVFAIVFDGCHHAKARQNMRRGIGSVSDVATRRRRERFQAWRVRRVFCDPALVCHCESRRPFRYGFDSSQARQTVRWGRFQALLFAPETRAKVGCGTRRLCTFAARKPVEKAWTGLYEPRNGLSNKAARTLPEKQAGHTCKRFFSLARLFQGCE